MDHPQHQPSSRLLSLLVQASYNRLLLNTPGCFLLSCIGKPSSTFQMSMAVKHHLTRLGPATLAPHPSIHPPQELPPNGQRLWPPNGVQPPAATTCHGNGRRPLFNYPGPYLWPPVQPRIFTISGDSGTKANIAQQTPELRVDWGKRQFSHAFLVASLNDPNSCIVGVDMSTRTSWPLTR
jgi:hypothetical protein